MPSFSSTIRRVHMERKLSDIRASGYFVERNSIDAHWAPRLLKLREHLPAPAVFLCGRVVYRYVITDIRIEPRPTDADRSILTTPWVFALRCEGADGVAYRCVLCDRTVWGEHGEVRAQWVCKPCQRVFMGVSVGREGKQCELPV